jgi:spermidine synthase
VQSLLAVESPYPQANSLLRFLEPPDSCMQSLWSRLFEGTYPKPFIVDSGLRRSLHFNFDGVQSAMDLLDPDRLTLAYTRRMMAFLLFNGAPKRILLLGLGGGSLAKFCYRRLPEAAVTAIEVNSDVMALREEFQIPPDDDRFRVVHGNASEYVARTAICKDVVLADGYDRSGLAPELDTVEFYQSAHRCLSPEGILVINLCGDLRGREAHLRKLRQVFGEDFLTLPVRQDGNVIAFAFKAGCGGIRSEELEDRAPELKRRFELNFPRYVRRIALDLQLRRWQQVLSSDAP